MKLPTWYVCVLVLTQEKILVESGVIVWRCCKSQMACLSWLMFSLLTVLLLGLVVLSLSGVTGCMSLGEESIGTSLNYYVWTASENCSCSTCSHPVGV